jgi:hypothetical protein
MTAIECRAGQIENSEGMDLLLHTARERRMMRKKRKIVGRRTKRLGIQYPEDETIKIESGRF